MASKQNTGLSPEEEYQYFTKHKRFNRPEDTKYVEESFEKNPDFKPYYMIGLVSSQIFDNDVVERMFSMRTLSLEKNGQQYSRRL